jgi:hypothetical protein
MIGVWASATRATQLTGANRMAAAGAKLCMLLGTIAGLHFLISTVPGRATILKARLNPALADYLIARTAADEVTFTGALNDRAVRQLKEKLSRTGIKVLRIRSHGGLVVPVMELAGVIAARKIAVSAGDACLSSCTLLLAASPNAIVSPTTRVSFHRPTPAVLTNASDSTALALTIAQWHARFREFGIAPKAVAEMARRDVWTPGLQVLADMGLVKFVLDGKPPKLTPVQAWCRAHQAACQNPSPQLKPADQ